MPGVGIVSACTDLAGSNASKLARRKALNKTRLKRLMTFSHKKSRREIGCEHANPGSCGVCDLGHDRGRMRMPSTLGPIPICKTPDVTLAVREIFADGFLPCAEAPRRHGIGFGESCGPGGAQLTGNNQTVLGYGNQRFVSLPSSERAKAAEVLCAVSRSRP